MSEFRSLRVPFVNQNNKVDLYRMSRTKGVIKGTKGRCQNEQNKTKQQMMKFLYRQVTQGLKPNI